MSNFFHQLQKNIIYIKKHHMPNKAQNLEHPTARKALYIWITSTCAMLTLFLLDTLYTNSQEASLVIAPFGASAVLLFGAPQSPLAQPRNVIGGHVLSAFVGVTLFYIVGDYVIFAASIAVSTAIALMYLTKTLHPPGGATALIGVIGGESIHKLGYIYVLMPCAVGAFILVCSALILRKIKV